MAPAAGRGKEQRPKHGGRSTFTPPFLCECRWLINLKFALASLAYVTTHHNATAVRRTIGQSCIAATATPRWWARPKQYGSARAKQRCGACVETRPRPAVNDLLEWRLVFEGIECALTAHCDGSEGVWVGDAVDSCRSTMQCMRVFMARRVERLATVIIVIGMLNDERSLRRERYCSVVAWWKI